MKTKPFIMTSVCGTVLLLAAAGTGLYINEMNQKNLANGDKLSSTRSALSEELPDDLLSVDEIKSIAVKKAPNASVHTIILEKSDKKYRYKTKLDTGTIIYFDARTGEHISTNHGEALADATPIDTSKINFSDARKIALTNNPNGQISKIELLNENGALTYCVWFGDVEHIDVRAKDGAVTHVDLKNTSSQSKPNDTTKSTPPALDKVRERARENPSIDFSL